MKLVYFILVVVALIVAISMPIALGEIIFYKWVRHTHPNFDREFSKTENCYVETAQASLSEFQESEKYPTGKYMLMHMIAFPYFVLSGGIVFGISYYIHDWLNAQNTHFVSDFMIGTFGLAASAGAGLFATWLCYFTLSKNALFIEWLVLNHSSLGRETTESIVKRRLAQIEHDVRIRRLDVLSNFSPSEFLQSIYRRHQRYTGIAACIFLALAASVGLLAEFT